MVITIQLLPCATEKNRQRNTSTSMICQPSASLPRTRSTTFAARAVRLWNFEPTIRNVTSGMRIQNSRFNLRINANHFVKPTKELSHCVLCLCDSSVSQYAIKLMAVNLKRNSHEMIRIKSTEIMDNIFITIILLL